MSYVFIDLLILMYFEWWKLFNYLFHKKHVDRKKQKTFGINKHDYTDSWLYSMYSFKIRRRYSEAWQSNDATGAHDKYNDCSKWPETQSKLLKKGKKKKDSSRSGRVTCSYFPPRPPLDWYCHWYCRKIQF